MTGGGQEELDAFMSAIRSEQERTQGLLKQSAVRDYEQFIVMSREVSGLDSEMAQLRRNLDSLSALSEQLFAFDIGSSPSSSALDEPSDAGKSESRARASKRSSILDLENLYVTQMRSLWDRVEGSQKFLPAIPGRHVVYESGRWIELNSATWRRKRLVHLILLNDGVLIAVQKRSKPAAASSGGDTAKDGSSAGAKATRLVAERFFPIAQMRLSSINETNLNKPGLYSSMAPSSVLKYAINIMYSGERIVLQTNAADEKTKLLAAFSSLASDLKQQQQRTATKKEKENDYRSKKHPSPVLWPAINTQIPSAVSQARTITTAQRGTAGPLATRTCFAVCRLSIIGKARARRVRRTFAKCRKTSMRSTLRLLTETYSRLSNACSGVLSLPRRPRETKLLRS